jgi:hypothetical protein
LPASYLFDAPTTSSLIFIIYLLSEGEGSLKQMFLVDDTSCGTKCHFVSHKHKSLVPR